MLAATELGQDSASEGRGLGEGNVWLMGALGGSLLGADGLSALVNEPGLSIGDGLEGFPDGPGAGAAVDNLLINNLGDNLLINDMGDVRLIGTPSANGASSFDMSSGLPAGLAARNGQTFQNVGSFTETIVPFVDPFNGDKSGYWSTVDTINAAQPFDIRLTFAWTSDATGPPNVRIGPGVFAPSLSVDGLSPYVTGVVMDRNSSLVFTQLFAPGDILGTDGYDNKGANHTLTGSELTADGTTLHTVGFSLDGLAYRSFFDGTEIDAFDLTASERADVDFCARVGVWYFNDGETELHYRHSLLEAGPAGSIYP